MKKITSAFAWVLLLAAAWLAAPSAMASAPQVFSPDPNLPPLPGVYVSPALWHAAYAQGIIIRDVSHSRFTQNLPLPPVGSSQSHTFSSTLTFEVSTDGGTNYQQVSGLANVSVDVTHTTDDPDGTSRADAEMTALDLTISTGPGSTLKLRESPTLPSKGKTTSKPVAGGAMISSFFDIFTEVSTDNGATWLPAQQAAHVELRNDSGAVDPVTEPTPLLPPPTGEYVSPEQWHAAYAQGIIISNVSHKEFTDSHPPPTAGTSTHSFGSQLDLEVSTDGGTTFHPTRATANVQVQVTKVQGQGTDGFYDTEMLSLNFTLPGPLMVRESPTLPSRGQTRITTQADGTSSIASFFDIFTELSTDGGATWSPSTTGPVRVQLEQPAPEQPPNPTSDLPPQNGQYVSPDDWHAAYAQGIIISNVSHSDFLSKQPPPPPGGQQVHNFGSMVQMMVSLDGGQTFIPASGQANVAVRVRSSQDYGNTRYFDTEMLQLSLDTISGLPLRLRESPTRPSLGRTSIRLDGGQYRIGSFFDIFTEVSMDGGATWLTNRTGPAKVGLRTPPPVPVTVACPSDITMVAAGPGGAVVTFTATGSGGCGGPVTVTATPASGSLFPIGTTTVTVVATDPCGNIARCTFRIIVNPPPQPVPEYFFKQRKAPPTDGVYISPAQWHVLYASGIVIRDVRHRGFLQNFDLPPAGGTSVHSFSSTVDFEVSQTGPAGPFVPASGSANVTVRVTHSLDSAGQSFFDTEMLALDLTSGTIRLRESPTLPSRGQTTLRTVAGGYMIGSFFDVFTELSTDGGVSWSPAQDAGHVELRPDPKKVEPVNEPTTLLPPPNDQYVSPQEWHALYAQGIVIKDVRHKFFTDSHPPPPTGGTTTHAFNSQLDLQVSTDGGNTFQTVRVPAPVQVQVSSASAGSDAMYDTEMLSLNLTLPSGAMVRESPTLPSRGGTRITAEADGAYRIGSFFDIFTELSTDGGATWSPASNGPVRVELQALAPEQTETSPNLPPPADEYISPEKWHALYANGIIISNASHNRFTQSQPPPPPGGSQTHSFGSQVEMDVVMPGQLPVHVTVPASVAVHIASTTKDTGETRYFDTEMLQLNLSGLPNGMLIRESPTRASLGRTSVRLSGTEYRIGSFFDIFTELSTDGGATWHEVIGGPAGVRLRNPLVPPVSVICSADVYKTATSLAGAVVTYPPAVAAGGCGPLTVTCTPPSGSTFPIGTTIVTCVAQDACGNKATCTFKVVVRPPIKKRVFPTKDLPPLDGQYISPQQWHALYASGIIITNASHKRFLASQPPPPPGGTQDHSFGSTVEFDILQPSGGQLHVVAPAQVTVQVHNGGTSGGDEFYDTEMLQLDIQGGGLPPGVMIRESPTRQSTGETRIRPTTGGYAIDSFFDVFTELSQDGGQTWEPSDTPARMELARDTSNTSATINDVQSQGGNLVVTVPTQFGLYSFLECKDSLEDPDWITINGVVGSGPLGSSQTDFFSSGLQQRYYRVRMEEVLIPTPPQTDGGGFPPLAKGRGAE